MAMFVSDIDENVLNDIIFIDENYDHIFGGMTKAAAKVVLQKVNDSMPSALKKDLTKDNVKLSKVYKTPSDDGINTKVMIAGYFINSKGKKTPAPLVANMFEYGSDVKNYPKHPFFRKSFKKDEILKAMETAQHKLSGGRI